jgi:hypothetical protein
MFQRENHFINKSILKPRRLNMKCIPAVNRTNRNRYNSQFWKFHVKFFIANWNSYCCSPCSIFYFLANEKWGFALGKSGVFRNSSEWCFWLNGKQLLLMFNCSIISRLTGTWSLYNNNSKSRSKIENASYVTPLYKKYLPFEISWSIARPVQLNRRDLFSDSNVEKMLE